MLFLQTEFDRPAHHPIEKEQQRYPFSVQIPLLVSSSPFQNASLGPRARQAPLPPSLELYSETVKFSVRYQLRAVLVRPGFLNRDVTTTKSINIQPLQPPDLFNNEDDIRTSSLASLDNPGATGETPPPFELRSSAPRIVRPGDCLKLHVSLRIQPGHQIDTMPMWLTNLTFRLRVRTIVNTALSVEADDSYFTLWSQACFRPILLDRGSIDFLIPDSLWNRSVIPSLTPSFDCCGVSRSYQLQVVATVSPVSKSKAWVSRSCYFHRKRLTCSVRAAR